MNISKIILSERLENDLLQICKARLPYEACGLVMGDKAAETVTATGFTVLRNIAADPTRAFRIAPDDYVAAVYEAQKNQRNIVGFFHSHPSSGPIPSIQDSQGWLSSPETYWIVGLGSPDAVSLIRVYRSSVKGEWASIPLAR